MISVFHRSRRQAAAKRVGEMNRHGHSTDRVRGVDKFGAMGPGVEGRRHCTFRFIRLLLMMLMLFRFSVGWCQRIFGRCSVFGVSFISFRGFLGSSKSKFFFELDFVVNDYFKINTSFVRV